MKWIALVIVLLVIAPALLARGAEMRQQITRSEVGAVALVGCIRLGIRLEWRIQV